MFFFFCFFVLFFLLLPPPPPPPPPRLLLLLPPPPLLLLVMRHTFCTSQEWAATAFGSHLNGRWCKRRALYLLRSKCVPNQPPSFPQEIDPTSKANLISSSQSTPVHHLPVSKRPAAIFCPPRTRRGGRSRVVEQVPMSARTPGQAKPKLGLECEDPTGGVSGLWSKPGKVGRARSPW